jgi:hypothetical protein
MIKKIISIFFHLFFCEGFFWNIIIRDLKKVHWPLDVDILLLFYYISYRNIKGYYGIYFESFLYDLPESLALNK